MEGKELFIFKNLETKSNTIVGFVIIQSLLLADRFTKAGFKEKLHGIPYLTNYIIIGHIILLTGATIFLIVLNRKLSRIPGDTLKEVYSQQTMIVRICLTLFFGLIPLIVMFNI